MNTVFQKNKRVLNDYCTHPHPTPLYLFIGKSEYNFRMSHVVRMSQRTSSVTELI